MPHPYDSYDGYIFWWVYLFLLFYPVYILPFFFSLFLKKYRYTVIYSVIVVGGFIALCGFNSGLLYPTTAVLLSLGIRYLQVYKKTYQGKKQTFNLCWLYVLLPLLGAGVWPIYLIYPAAIEYWVTRPSSECKQNGRLIALSPDAVYRIYPKYGDQFWISAKTEGIFTGGTFNVSEKEFCDAFSPTQPRLIDHLEFSFSELCYFPKTPNQKAYCRNVEQDGLELNGIKLDLSSLKNFGYRGGWQGLQDELNEEWNKKLMQENNPNTKRYYGNWIKTLQFENQVMLHEFYRSGTKIVIDKPDWLQIQPEPVVLRCSPNYKIRCHTTYVYGDGWHIEYLYSLAKDNSDYRPDDESRYYDQAYIDKQLEAFRQADQIARSILEEMREK